MMDGHRRFVVSGIKIIITLTGIVVDFYEVTARQTGQGYARCIHLGDVDSVFIDFYLVRQLEITLKLTIEEYVDGLSSRCVPHSETPAYLECHEIAHQGLIPIVVDECPVFCLCRHAENLMFSGELQLIWLFVKVPRRVATSLHVHTVLIE